MDSIPDEVIVHVVSFLAFDQAAVVHCVSKRLYLLGPTTWESRLCQPCFTVKEYRERRVVGRPVFLSRTIGKPLLLHPELAKRRDVIKFDATDNSFIAITDTGECWLYTEQAIRLDVRATDCIITSKGPVVGFALVEDGRLVYGMLHDTLVVVRTKHGAKDLVAFTRLYLIIADCPYDFSLVWVNKGNKPRSKNIDIRGAGHGMSLYGKRIYPKSYYVTGMTRYWVTETGSSRHCHAATCLPADHCEKWLQVHSRPVYLVSKTENRAYKLSTQVARDICHSGNNLIVLNQDGRLLRNGELIIDGVLTMNSSYESDALCVVQE
jgi:hypothetical protein